MIQDALDEIRAWAQDECSLSASGSGSISILGSTLSHSWTELFTMSSIPLRCEAGLSVPMCASGRKGAKAQISLSACSFEVCDDDSVYNI